MHHSVSIWDGVQVSLLATPWSRNVHARPKDKPSASSAGQIATLDPQDRRESEEQDSNGYKVNSGLIYSVVREDIV